MRKNVTTQAGFVPLKTVMKEVFIDLYSKGTMPKQITQKVYNILKLKAF